MQTLMNESASFPEVASQKPGRDPVFGMEVDPSRPKGGTVLHEGQLYGFCNAKWRSCSPRRRKGERVPTPCPR